MTKSAFILQPTSLATQLSALFANSEARDKNGLPLRRPVINKSIPSMASNGRPIDPAAAAKRSLRLAIAKFNNASPEA